MSFANTNNMVWKQIAEEKQNAARQMARVAMGLFVITGVLAATTFSARSNYSSMCTYVGERHAADAAEYKENELTKALMTDYCS